MEKWLVGIDLGGTTTKIAFITQTGEFVHKWEIKTDTSENGQHIVDSIAKAIDAKLLELNETADRLEAIGMGAPGPVDAKTGTVYEAVNLGWTNYPLQAALNEATGLPVAVDNDANIAALGEMWKGAGVGARNLVCVTLGTGVGGGIITNGQLVQGASGAAGEIGHITVIPFEGSPCNCGKSGCLETVASATGIVKVAMERLNESPSELKNILDKNGFITSKDVMDCAVQGDDYALSVIDRVSYYLGLSLANMANVLNPEIIVIGGGVSRAGDILLNTVREYFERFAFVRVRKSTTLKIATLGNDAGVIGGAKLVQEILTAARLAG
ncbi:MAG: ROK family glucokinase [Bacillus sp. (in: firmicutes)]